MTRGKKTKRGNLRRNFENLYSLSLSLTDWKSGSFDSDVDV